MTTQLQKKIDFAIKLLQSIPTEGEIELSYSGGKDSDVILELVKMAQIPFRAIYKNTTIDPPGTIAHCKSKGVEIVQPKTRFFDVIKRKGMPSMFARFCCSELKEYKILDRAIFGIRRCESVKRTKRYKEPEFCRVYNKNSKVKAYLPILEWTNEDVAAFIAEHNIKCHPLYYDEQGNFHVERRLGCLGCPLSRDRGKADFLKYPKLLKLWIKNAQIFLDTHPKSRSSEIFGGNAHHQMLYRIFYLGDMRKYQNLISGGLFPETAVDPKTELEKLFKIDLTI